MAEQDLSLLRVADNKEQLVSEKSEATVEIHYEGMALGSIIPISGPDQNRDAMVFNSNQTREEMDSELIPAWHWGLFCL